MSENKTLPSDASVLRFLEGVTPERKRVQSITLNDLMQEVCGEPPVIWGKNMVGFGQYHYRYKSGREGTFFRLGFAPRKSALTIYIMPGFDNLQDELEALGKHKTSVSCLYIANLDAVDLEILKTIVQKSWAEMAIRYPL